MCVMCIYDFPYFLNKGLMDSVNLNVVSLSSKFSVPPCTVLFFSLTHIQHVINYVRTVTKKSLLTKVYFEGFPNKFLPI